MSGTEAWVFFHRTTRRRFTLTIFWVRDRRDLSHPSALQLCARYLNHRAYHQLFTYLLHEPTLIWIVHSRLTIPQGVLVSMRQAYPAFTRRTTTTVSKINRWVIGELKSCVKCSRATDERTDLFRCERYDNRLALFELLLSRPWNRISSRCSRMDGDAVGTDERFFKPQHLVSVVN